MTKFIACQQTGPGEPEVISKPVGLDQAQGAAEIRAEYDGWATRSFNWRPGEREGLLVLWACRPYRDEPAAGGRYVGAPKNTGYTVMKQPPRSRG